MTSPEAKAIEAIGQLGFANPFGRRRVQLEAAALGRDRVRETYWSRPIDWPVGDTVLRDISERAEQLFGDAQAMLRRRATDDDTRRIYGRLALYVLYYRYEPKFFVEVVQPAPSPSNLFYDDFKRDAAQLFQHVIVPRWARDPAELFAIFFQLRRGFHFIFHRILGRSRAVARLREAVWESVFTHDPERYLAHLHGRMHEVSTLILGPSGTGKELVASAIGAASYIEFNPSTKQFARDFRWSFVPLHLAAMSPTLIESELFGHSKGAFTGAISDRTGHLEGRVASDTVFLDEIGELSADVQVKLLRVLQERRFHRIGDSEERAFGGKVVAATNRDLAEQMAAGRFREDLYYRLCSDVIRTPALREQLTAGSDELTHLVQLLAARLIGDFDAGDAARLVGRIIECVGEDYSWPGNVRELEQCVRNILVHDTYMPAGAKFSGRPLEDVRNRMEQVDIELDDVVAAYSAWAYEQTGSFERAAEALGVDRRTVSKHVRQSTKR